MKGTAAASLDVAVVVCAVGFGHVHLAHGVANVVHPISARWHALVDSIQAFGLREAADLVLWREASDGCGEARHRVRDGKEHLPHIQIECLSHL